VIAYEIDGPLNDDAPDAALRTAYLKFTAAAAGVTNARFALDYAQTEMPEIDKSRIFVAGHSSAGTLALLCAAHLEGLAGCAAYAPCSDLEKFLVPMINQAGDLLPGLRQYAVEGSPVSHVEQIDCPVMLFQAIDDRVVPYGDTMSFQNRLRRAGVNVKMETTSRGGHYDAMIEEGIPRAIAWMNRLGGGNASPAPTPESRPSDRPFPIVPALPPIRTPPSFPSGAQPGGVRAHVHLTIVSYPASGDAETLAKNALRTVPWIAPGTVRVDRDAGEVVMGARTASLNTGMAKSALERVGFAIGGTKYVPVSR